MKVTLELFTQGITDDIIGADPRLAARMRNFVLTRQGKLRQRPAAVLRFPGHPQIPPGNQRIDSIFVFDKTYFIKSGTKLYYSDDGSAILELQTLSSKVAFGDSILGAGVSWSTWRGHVFATPMPYPGAVSGCRTIKIYRDTDNAWVCEQAGVPSVFDDSGFTNPPSGIGSGSGGQEHQFIMAVCFRHRHTAKVDGVDVDFVNYGKPAIWTQRMEEPDTGVADYSFTAPDFANAALDNYSDANFGTATIRAISWRTKKNDKILLFDDDTTQGSTIVYERTDDEIGVNSDTRQEYDLVEFYMNGGRSENDKFPLAHYSLFLDSFSFVIGYIDPNTGILYHNRILQSNPTQVEGYYYGNFAEFNGHARGLDRVGSYPIILSDIGATRVEGRFDAFGGGGMKTFFIQGSEPALSGKAVVRLDDAIIYASSEGWVWTNGFQAVNISKHLRERYGTLQTPANMACCYDSKTKFVLFSAMDPELADDNSGANNIIFVIDMRHSDPGRGTFLDWTGKFKANALAYDRANQLVLIGDHRGYLMTLDESLYADDRVNASISTALWAKIGIVWDYISVAMTAVQPGDEGFWTKVYAQCKKLTGNLSAQFSTIKNMDLESFSKVVRDRAKVGLHKVERWVSGGRWATYQQLRFAKAEVFIANSDRYGIAHVEPSALTVERINGYWPMAESGENLVGYSIYFDFDNYETAFEISGQSGNVLNVLDPTSMLQQTPEAQWMIKGYPKDETVEINLLALEQEDQGDPNESYRAGDDGSNT